MPDTNVANADQEAKLLVVISKANQEAWDNVVSLITGLEDYLETKYRLEIGDIEVGNVYDDPRTGVYIDVNGVHITSVSGDYQVADFLKKTRFLFRNIHDLGLMIKKLPANAVDVLNSISQIEARAHSLLEISQTELKLFSNRTKNETFILIIVTDLATIRQKTHTLMELSLGRAAAA